MAAAGPILEALHLQIIAGREEEFEIAFAAASPIIESMPGYLGHELRRSLEFPGRYLLMVSWETLADHEDGFRKSDEYQEWRGLLHHFYDPMPTMEHFERVYPAP